MVSIKVQIPEGDSGDAQTLVCQHLSRRRRLLEQHKQAKDANCDDLDSDVLDWGERDQPQCGNIGSSSVAAGVRVIARPRCTATGCLRHDSGGFPPQVSHSRTATGCLDHSTKVKAGWYDCQWRRHEGRGGNPPTAKIDLLFSSSDLAELKGEIEPPMFQ